MIRDFPWPDFGAEYPPLFPKQKWGETPKLKKKYIYIFFFLTCILSTHTHTCGNTTTIASYFSFYLIVIDKVYKKNEEIDSGKIPDN